jgi:RNA polymerase primary sigma factor
MKKMRDFKITQRIHTPNRNLARYFTEIQKEKILSVSEELELVIKAKCGDTKSKEKIIKSNLRFVVSVAKAYSSESCPLEDLISEGNQGLIEAIELFDHKTGFKFISYAVWHIRKNIFSYISKNSRQIRMPSNISRELNRYKKIEDLFFVTNGREGTPEEIFEFSEKMGNSDKDFSDILKSHIEILPQTFPLEPSMNNSSDDSEYSPINWIKSEEAADFLVSQSDRETSLSILLEKLNPFQKEIIKMKYGIGDQKEEMTFSQIGLRFNKSSEWARQRIKKAENIIRKSKK